MLIPPRFNLRQWQASDFAPFAKMNADLDVMAYFPALLTEEKSIEVAKKLQQLIADRGWGFWAVSVRECDTFIGFVGLHEPTTELPCAPCTEIGWRLDKAQWGKGYATEAAHEVLRFAFDELELDEVYAFTASINKPSIAVMMRIGMEDTLRDFNHPAIKPSHELEHHVLYRTTQEQWQQHS